MLHHTGSMARLFLAALALTLLPLGLAAQTPTVPAPVQDKDKDKGKPTAAKLPMAAQVLARSVKASGGAEALGKLTSSRQTLSIDFGDPMLGVKTMEIVMLRRTLDAGTKEERQAWAYRGEVDFGKGLGVAAEGSDGVHVWDMQPMQGPRLLEGVEKESKMRSIDPLGHHHWKRYYRTIKTLAREKIEGEACLKIEMTPKVGKKESHWFSEKTGLLLRTQGILETAMGDLGITTDMKDYEAVKPLGIIQAQTIVMTIAQMGPPRKITTKAYAVNVEVKESEVALPAEIQKLVEKEAKKNAEKGAEEK